MFGFPATAEPAAPRLDHSWWHTGHAAVTSPGLSKVVRLERSLVSNV